jgi:hypothetical protein
MSPCCLWVVHPFLDCRRRPSDRNDRDIRHTMNLTAEQERRHKLKLLQKLHRISGLTALLQTWAQVGVFDGDYIRGLRERLHAAEGEFKVMRP